jgi:hypothetical protein
MPKKVTALQLPRACRAVPAGPAQTQGGMNGPVGLDAAGCRLVQMISYADEAGEGVQVIGAFWNGGARVAGPNVGPT